jgi:hypothetical protein
MILIITPLNDIATGISINAGKELERFCIENKISYKTLTVMQAYRAIFESTLLFSKNIDLIAYYGHGVEDGLFGQHYLSKMLDVRNNRLLKDKIIFTMACWTGNELGPNTIEKGAKSYFGHGNWYYGAITNSEHSYFEDWIDYVTIIPKELLRGKTTGEALFSYKNLIGEYLNKYEDNRYLDWDWYTYTAKSNLNYFKLFGDRNIKLEINKRELWHE